MENVQIDLSELKGLHIPTPPPFWPLATGWYILFILFIIIIICGILLYKHHKNKPLPYALHELKKINTYPQNQQMKMLSQLLKRVAMLRYSRESIAPLVEEKWSDFLLASAPNIFSKTQANHLAFAIYNPKVPSVDKKLLDNSKRWIKATLKSKQK